MIAARIDSTVIRVAFGVYVVLNLVGTAMLLREVRDQAPLPGRHPERWPFLVELTFVLQLPVGIVVVLSGGS